MRLSGSECLAGYRGKVCLPTPVYGPEPLDVLVGLRGFGGLDRDGNCHGECFQFHWEVDRD